MQFIKLLSGAVAYTVIMLEVYSGAIQGPQWWVLPGALVLALLIAIQLHFEVPVGAEVQRAPNLNPLLNIARWLMTLILAVAASYLANHFGREMIPCHLLSLEGWSAPAETMAKCAR